MKVCFIWKTVAVLRIFSIYKKALCWKLYTFINYSICLAKIFVWSFVGLVIFFFFLCQVQYPIYCDNTTSPLSI